MRLSAVNYNFKTAFKGSDNLKDIIGNALKNRSGSIFGNPSDCFVPNDLNGNASRPIMIDKLEINTNDDKKPSKGNISRTLVDGGAGLLSGYGISEAIDGQANSSNDQNLDIEGMIDEKLDDDQNVGVEDTEDIDDNQDDDNQVEDSSSDENDLDNDGNDDDDIDDGDDDDTNSDND